MGESAIRFGQITLTEGQSAATEPARVATLSYSLREERERWSGCTKEIQNGAKIPMVEADAVVRSLSIAMHAEQAMVLPLLQLKEFDQYTTTHSMNVAVLAMPSASISIWVVLQFAPWAWPACCTTSARPAYLESTGKAGEAHRFGTAGYP